MEQQRVIALGFFDGVHLGHGALLREAVRIAGQRGLKAAAISFDRHPGTLIPGRSVKLLSSCAEREALMRRLYGIDEVIFLHFDRARMEQPWQKFVTQTLVRQYGAAHVICGESFRFGYRGEGTPELLRRCCAAHGVGVTVIAPVQVEGRTVSSTYIRQLLAEGDVLEAARYLGHRHCFTGEVSHGAHLGSSLGFPTANLLVPEELLAPRFGVYATVVYCAGRAYGAVTNVGVAPTVGARPVRIESNLLDFAGDLYGRTIRVEFQSFLRAETRFASLKALKDAIAADAKAARRCLAEEKLQNLAEECDRADLESP